MEDCKKVVIYKRVSTEDQAREGFSLENQEHDIRRECEVKGYEAIDVCADEGISGKDIQGRSGLMKALKYIKNKEAQGIVVWKLSRLSRNTADTMNIVDLLKKNDGFLVSIKDGLDTQTPQGQMMAAVLGIIAEVERDNIVGFVKGGMHQKARKGEWNGGVIPLGYDLKDKQFTINE